jgi:phosphatidylserine synthase
MHDEPREADAPNADAPKVDASSEETPKERVDRELIEFLNESRLVLPGVQVLFAFLLGLAFTTRFDSMESREKLTYSVAFFSTALASILMITPSSFHRLRFRKGDKERILKAANRLILAAIVCLGVAMVSVIWLVAELLYTEQLANLIGVAAIVIVVGLWFALPLRRTFMDHR